MKQKSHKTDCSVYMTAEQKAVLQSVSLEQGISVNRLILNLIEKKYPVKKSMRKKAVAQKPLDTTDTEQKEARLQEVNQMLKKAYGGETLPPDEYHKLKKEQANLRSILNHK